MTAADAPAPPRAHDATAASAVEFLLAFVRAGHAAGYPTADLEERVISLADALGLVGAQVSATPTVVDVSLGTLPEQRSFTLRVKPTGVDLSAIASLDDVVHGVLDGKLDAREALAAVVTIETHPLERPRLV